MHIVLRVLQKLCKDPATRPTEDSLDDIHHFMVTLKGTQGEAITKLTAALKLKSEVHWARLNYRMGQTNNLLDFFVPLDFAVADWITRHACIAMSCSWSPARSCCLLVQTFEQP